MRTRRIRDAVIVITGASSGIGRGAAVAFARRGGTMVLAARRAEALTDVARECERAGGRAMVVPTDVSDEAAVRELARRAIEQFGRIDVWVNNAAVTLFARFEEAPPEAYRRVLETNLFGYIHGARAVLPYFREQGGGVQEASAPPTAGNLFEPMPQHTGVTGGWAERQYGAVRRRLAPIGMALLVPAAILAWVWSQDSRRPRLRQAA